METFKVGDVVQFKDIQMYHGMFDKEMKFIVDNVYGKKLILIPTEKASFFNLKVNSEQVEIVR